MSRVLEFFLGSILIAVFTVAFMFFFTLHYILRGSGVSECAWQGSARTWVDSNRDGLINAGESPLSDVKVHVDDIQNQWIDISWPVITDQDGDVQFNVSIPGCSNTLFEIYVEIPEGYRVTTKPRIEVNPDVLENLNAERVYYFGFVFDY
jgi:hypothetical protein